MPNAILMDCAKKRTLPIGRSQPAFNSSVEDFFARRGGDAHFHPPLNKPPAAESSYIQYQRESYKKVASDPEYWPKIFDKLGRLQWQGFSKEELASIKAPVLIALGDLDFVRLEHAVESFNLIPNAEFAVIPDAGHFTLFSEPERVIPVVKHFLEKSAKTIPVSTAATGYYPGETR